MFDKRRLAYALIRPADDCDRRTRLTSRTSSIYALNVDREKENARNNRLLSRDLFAFFTRRPLLTR
jgi:hypothetical protein